MEPSSVEIKSARAARIITFVFAVPCFCIAVFSLLSLFVPVFEGKPPTVGQAWFLGVGYFLFGAFLWWPVRKMTIRADEETLFHHNGFFATTVRWDEVASYYREENLRQSGRSHSEIIMLGAQQEILLQIPTHQNGMTPQAIEERRELWQFVEVQLSGKKMDGPYVSYEPAAIVARSLEVDWKSKTLGWKIARCCALLAYALFWLGLMACLLYLTIDDTLSSGVAMLLCFAILYVGPLLPYIVYTKTKQRKITREWETQNTKIES